MSEIVDTILAITTILVPLFGGFFTALGFYLKDKEKEPKSIVANTFLWGLFAGIFVVILTVSMFIGAQYVVESLNKEWAIILFMITIVLVEAFIEEAIKGFILWRRCKTIRTEVDGLYDGFLYGAILGTGVGVIDAIIYAILATDWLEGLKIAFIETVRMPGTHAFFSGLIGTYFAWHYLRGHKIIYGFMSVGLLHGLWNILTFLFHYYFGGVVFYILNFSLLGIYILMTMLISWSLTNYDKKVYPNGTPKEFKGQGNKCKVDQPKITEN